MPSQHGRRVVHVSIDQQPAALARVVLLQFLECDRSVRVRVGWGVRGVEQVVYAVLERVRHPVVFICLQMK